jgi:hypothetical protein
VSVFAKVPTAAISRAVDHLGTDVKSGAWFDRHRDLLDLDELDLGLRIVSCELSHP